MENCWFFGQRADLYGIRALIAPAWRIRPKRILFAAAKRKLYPRVKKEHVRSAHRNCLR